MHQTFGARPQLPVMVAGSQLVTSFVVRISLPLFSVDWCDSYTNTCIVQLAATATTRPGLRSASTEVYRMPRLKTVFGERAFSHAGPAVWNSLPASTQASTNTTSFCRLLKTHISNLAFTYDIAMSTVLFYFVTGH